MLNSLFPKINWEAIRFAGFDLDGTLYDEFDFISQVYRPVARKIAVACGADEAHIYKRLSQRWLEKGSSYSRIFSEVLLDAGLDESAAKDVIDDCLSLFRNFQPDLRLSERTRSLLDYMAERHPMFLVTDGSCTLQQAKIDALGLERWFAPGNIAISGCVGKGLEKPSTEMLGRIAILAGRDRAASDTVYFGDREVDRQFAMASRFHYVRVKNMFNVEG